MDLLAVGGARQQEGEAAEFQHLRGLLAGKLYVDHFHTVMAGNVPNPEFPSNTKIQAINQPVVLLMRLTDFD